MFPRGPQPDAPGPPSRTDWLVRRPGNASRRILSTADTLLNSLSPSAEDAWRTPAQNRKVSLAKTEDLYEVIRKVRDLGKLKSKKMAYDLVKYLVLVRGEKPNTFLYETLLMANSATEGSADVVRALLKEMRNANIQWSSTAYHSALRAFAVHPDYMARNAVIEEMRERWIEITPEGLQWIAVGLLRDGQYEIALEKLDEMIRDGVQVSPWVLDTFIYVFVRLEFFDDALRIVRHRLEHGAGDVSVSVWYALLEACSRGQHLEATKYVWNRAVQPRLLTPSDGIALNVLNAASRHGDSKLATQVIQYLSARETTLELHHYEALADCYALNGDIEHAFDVLCIMQAAGITPPHGSTGSIHQCFKRDPALVDRAVKALLEQKKTRDLPVALFNTVLTGVLTLSTSEPAEAFQKALDMYRRIRELRTKPDAQTFMVLLRGCSRPEDAAFLEAELKAFRLNTTKSIDKEFLRIFSSSDDKRHTYKAKYYFGKILPAVHANQSAKKEGVVAQGSREWQEIMEKALKLAEALLRQEDPTVWRILDACRDRGLDEINIQAVLRRVAREKEAEKGTQSAVEAWTTPGSQQKEAIAV